jgi:hypothetical protein
MKTVTAMDLVDTELSAQERRALAARAAHSVVVRWFDQCIAVGFEHAGAAQIFRHRYRAFITDTEPRLRAYAVQSDDALDQPVFFCEAGPACRYPARLRGDEVIAFLADAVVQRSFFDIHDQIVSFHAAAVRIGDGAVAISAVSTGGKSTTAIACARRGMGLYTDERCVIKDGMVQAFPRAVNLRCGGLELLSSDDIPGDRGIGDRLRKHTGDEWISASFADVIGTDELPGPAPLDAMYFIIGRGRVARVEALARHDAIVQLLHAGLCGPPHGLDRVAAASALCRTIRAYSLVLGTPDDTALLIAATTRRARPLIAVTS